jgi:hypothetical protein
MEKMKDWLINVASPALLAIFFSSMVFVLPAAIAHGEASFERAKHASPESIKAASLYCDLVKDVVMNQEEPMTVGDLERIVDGACTVKQQQAVF